MNEEESIFGTEPERLMRLMRSGLEADKGEVDGGAGEAAPAKPLTEQPGTRIGRYKLLRMLGEGGMGIVYLAEQQGSIRRRVALKVIKPGMDSKRVLARFEAERQALALLDHPNIAHVYDAGTTEAGRPYFVMEHVKGLQITEYCDQRKLSIEDRLALFVQVCHAVHHAHQKGIIHRDIKPPNILVTTREDQSVPKIIDFGVAKAVIQPLTERTLYTEQGQLFGTPEYMSPEQADMASEDIDTRSDIYSLGILLYELLTGVLPFDSDTLRTGGIEHIRQIIREIDPKTPSTRLTRLGEEARKVAENRRTEIAALAKCLHRELEWIPLKAMRKERTERYRSASELADDIENYLKGAPLMAGPPTSGYRLRKILRRHKVLVAGIAAVLVVSIVGTIVSVTFALGQASALAQNKAMADFLNNDILDPLANAEMQGVTIRKVLDAAIEKLGIRFSDSPLLEASMRFRFGNIYIWQFGDYDVALPSLERALELRQQHGKDRPLDTMNWLGLAYAGAGKYQEAETMFRTIVESIESGERGPSELYPFAKSHLGGTYRKLGRYDVAERHLRKALDVAPWDKESPWRLCYSGGLATVFMNQGRYEEALKETESACGPEHSRTVNIKFALAVLRTKQGDYEEAGSLFDEILRNMQGRLDNDHPELLKTKSHLGVLRREQGKHDEAEKLLSETLQGQREKLGPDHPHALKSMHELAVLYKEEAHYEEAKPLLLKAVEGRRLKLGDEHPHTLESWHNLIELYESWNKPEKAEEWRIKLPRTEAVE